jgi:hypothetical protein
MTDLIEARLRELFAEDADRAPVALDLATGARRVAHRQTRRRAAVVGCGVLVALLTVSAALLFHTQPGHGSSPAASKPPTSSPSTSGGATSTPTPDEPSALYYRNVEVPVPASMLDPAAVKCGTAVADAAYVTTGARRACLTEPAHPERLTTVVLQPTETLPAHWAAGTRVLPDGRTQISSGVPGGDLTITVTSPDAKRADRLFNGLRIVDTAHGCAVQETVAGPNPALPAPSAVTGGSACVYDSGGWLTASGWLDAAAGARFVEALRVAEAGAGCSRIGPNNTNAHWSIHLRVEDLLLVFRIPQGACETGLLERYVAEVAPPHTG